MLQRRHLCYRGDICVTEETFVLRKGHHLAIKLKFKLFQKSSCMTSQIDQVILGDITCVTKSDHTKMTEFEGH